MSSFSEDESKGEKMKFLLGLKSKDSTMVARLSQLPFSFSVLKRIVLTLQLDSNSPLYDKVEQRGREAIKNIERSRASMIRVEVHQYLTTSEQQLIRASRPNMDIIFRNTIQVGHAKPAVSRVLDAAELQERLRPNDTVLDVGGRPELVLRHGRKNVTVAAPIMDYVDSGRHSAFHSEIRKIRNGAVISQATREVYDKYVNDPDSVVIFSPAESILNIQRDVVYALHSLYDIGLDNFAKIMYNTGARIGVGSILFHESMLTQSYGRLPCVDGEFNVDFDKDEITCGFVGDCSRRYVHKYSRYVSYWQDQAVRYKDGLFYYRVLNRGADTIRYEMVRLEGNRVYDSMLDFGYLNTHQAEYVKLGGISVDARYSTREMRYSRVEYLVPKDTIYRMMERGFIEKAKWQRSHMYDFARSQDIRFVQNGVAVKANGKIHGCAFDHCVNVIHALVVYMMEKQRIDCKEVIAEIMSQRAGSSSFQTWLKDVSGAVVSPLDGISKWVRDTLVGFMLENDDLPTIAECIDMQMIHINRETGMIVVPEKFQPFVENLDIPDFDEEDIETQLKYLDEAISYSDDEEEKSELKRMRELLVKDFEDSDDEFYDSLSSVVESEYTTEDSSVDDSDGVVEQSLEAITEYSRVCTVMHDQVIGEAVYFRDKTSTGNGNVDRARVEEPAVRPRGNLVNKLSTEDLEHNYIYFEYGQAVKVFMPERGDENAYRFVLHPDGCNKIKLNKGRLEGAGANKICGWLYTNSAFKIMNELELAVAARDSLSNSDNLTLPFDSTLVAGVPGCGKTTYVVDQAVAGGELDFMILVAGRNNAERVGELIADQLSDKFSRKDCISRVRTLDSFLLHEDQASFQRVYIDEGLMAHAGQLLAIRSKISGLSKFAVLGDPKQVVFVNFAREVDCRLSDISKFLGVEWKYITYRLPVLGACLVLHIYGGKIRVPPNAEMGEVSVVKIASENDIPVDKKAVYLCHYQWEKDLLRKRLNPVKKEADVQVHTVVEFQGDAADHVIIVRLGNRENTNLLYSKDDRVNSSLTRFRKSLRYYTLVDNDKTALWMKLLTTEENKRRVTFEYDKGGYEEMKVGNYVGLNAFKEYVEPDFRLLCRDAAIRTKEY